MDPVSLLSTSTDDGRVLLAAAQSGWDRPVPHCPEWNAEDLVRHTGGIFEWMAAVVAARERVSRRTVVPSPDDQADLSGWYLDALDRAVDVLGSAEPDSQTWTFSSIGDQRVAWWCRRLAVEIAIHRHDAELAAAVDGGPSPAPIDGDVAVAGVEEFMIEFLPGLLSGEGISGLNGTLHLHATDGPLEWWVDLGDAGAARPEHGKADTAVRATRSNLLLWLTNRVPSDSLEVIGKLEITERWEQLRR
jgi:uncharacterized protein (TIGR03083 family)